MYTGRKCSGRERRSVRRRIACSPRYAFRRFIWRKMDQRWRRCVLARTSGWSNEVVGIWRRTAFGTDRRTAPPTTVVLVVASLILTAGSDQSVQIEQSSSYSCCGNATQRLSHARLAWAGVHGRCNTKPAERCEMRRDYSSF